MFFFFFQGGREQHSLLRNIGRETLGEGMSRHANQVGKRTGQQGCGIFYQQRWLFQLHLRPPHFHTRFEALYKDVYNRIGKKKKNPHKLKRGQRK